MSSGAPDEPSSIGAQRATMAATPADSSTSPGPPPRGSSAASPPPRGSSAASPPPRLEALFKQGTAHERARKTAQGALAAECTFAPVIGRSPRAGGSRDVVARLLDKERSVEAARKLEAVRAASEKGLTFKPQLVSRTPAKAPPSAASRAVAHHLAGEGTPPAAALAADQRLYDDSAERRKRATARTAALVSQEGCTFTPVLTARAQALTRPGSAAERLYDPEWVRRRAAPERNDPTLALAAGLTFQPNLAGGAGRLRDAPAPATSSGSEAAGDGAPPTPEEGSAAEGAEAAAAGVGGGSSSAGERPDGAAVAATPSSPTATTPVHDRLYGESARQRARAEAAKARAMHDALAGVTFRPNTAASKASAPPTAGARMAASAGGGDGGGGGGSAGAVDAHERLYEHARALRERARLRDAVPPPADPACTFAPRLDPQSRRIVLEHELATAALDAALPLGGGEVGGASKPRHVVLYEEGLQRVKARCTDEANHVEAGIISEADRAACTFQPSVNHHLPPPPVHTGVTGAGGAGAGAGGSPASRLQQQPAGSAAAGGGSPLAADAACTTPAASAVLPACERLYLHALHKAELLKAAVSGAPLQGAGGAAGGGDGGGIATDGASRLFAASLRGGCSSGSPRLLASGGGGGGSAVRRGGSASGDSGAGSGSPKVAAAAATSPTPLRATSGATPRGHHYVSTPPARTAAAAPAAAAAAGAAGQQLMAPVASFAASPCGPETHHEPPPALTAEEAAPASSEAVAALAVVAVEPVGAAATAAGVAAATAAAAVAVAAAADSAAVPLLDAGPLATAHHAKARKSTSVPRSSGAGHGRRSAAGDGDKVGELRRVYEQAAPAAAAPSAAPGASPIDT